MKDTIENFGGLGLSEKIMRAVENAGYQKPSPIQARAIPAILEGRDVFGCAQTGTGKTAAFALPIMQMIDERGHYPSPKGFRALILTPTRELAEQIASNITVYGRGLDISSCKVYGGVSQNPQVKMLSKGVDILVATPGRLLDLYQQKHVDFSDVEYLVLDEADRMLDMGFINDIRKIVGQLPRDRQSLLFSATLSGEIESLARDIVRDPLKIMISPESPTVEKISQKIAFVEIENKFDLLEKMMTERLEKSGDALALIFCRTKHGANKLAKRLNRINIPADAIHGNKSQSARQNALNRFKSRETKILVATDIAARGIDVRDMTLVVNYDLPTEAETYVHRIGRTARAEHDGEAVSFCSTNEVDLLRDIERFIKKPIDILQDNPFHSEAAQQASARKSNGGGRPSQARGFGRAPRGNGAPQQRRNREFSDGENPPRRPQRDFFATSSKRESDSERGEPRKQERDRKQKNSRAKGEKVGGVLRGKMKKAGMKNVPTFGSKKPKEGFWQKIKNKLSK